ncbi:SLC13 family permease [Micromonospora musae]|uniref:SLC13 family permease n=1 Tax=Micromonospora musae TaxID=1894970 RepID=UPI0034021622
MTLTAPAPPTPTGTGRRWRPHPLDAVAVLLALAGAGCAASGLLPHAETTATVHRIAPLLVFLGTVVVLAELTSVAGVFDVLGTRLAIAARGRWSLLFLLCVAFATVTTVTLNLDTTAVLLTPVMLALARNLRVAPTALAVTTVWLANTASLLLPVSNLTNLLAADRLGLDPVGFAGRMWLPQLAAVTVTALLLWFAWWRRDRPPGGRFDPPPRRPPADPVLFRTAVAACVLFVVGVLAEVELAIVSTVAAVVLLTGFALRAPHRLHARLFPWRLLLMVSGLFLVVQTLGQWGLDTLVAGLLGSSDGPAALLRAGGTGALLANGVNNLPAYLAGESVLSHDSPTRLLALLIGTNAGPLAVPWASVATLLWFERCRSHGVTVPLPRFLLTGALLALTGTAAAVGALLLT